MPVCFQLLDRDTREPVSFAALDDAICAHLNVKPDEVKYYLGWYDFIGLALAMGKDWTDIRERTLKAAEHEPFWSGQMMKIIDFIEARYTSNNWVEVGRR